MPSPYDRLNGEDERRKKGGRKKSAVSKQAIDIMLAVAVLVVGVAIGALRGGLGGNGSGSADTGSQGSSSSQSASGSSGSNSSSGSSESGSGDATGTTQQAAGDAQADLAGSAKATDVLAHLAVKGRAPKTGYSREQFGTAWADVDHNGCDTRNDILSRDLTDKTYKPGTHECIVLTGTLADPYTGKTIHFQRGQKTSSAVQIDHVVALSDAWQTGAQKIGTDNRRRLANDPYNLLAVDGPANQQKSDSDAASWLPSNKSARCGYVARQIGVKRKYALWVTSAEKTAMGRVLSSCPSQTVPKDSTGI
jgi:hypothetical protein